MESCPKASMSCLLWCACISLQKLAKHSPHLLILWSLLIKGCLNKCPGRCSLSNFKNTTKNGQISSTTPNLQSFFPFVLNYSIVLNDSIDFQTHVFIKLSICRAEHITCGLSDSNLAMTELSCNVKVVPLISPEPFWHSHNCLSALQGQGQNAYYLVQLRSLSANGCQR